MRDEFEFLQINRTRQVRLLINQQWLGKTATSDHFSKTTMAGSNGASLQKPVQATTLPELSTLIFTDRITFFDFFGKSDFLLCK